MTSKTWKEVTDGRPDSQAMGRLQVSLIIFYKVFDVKCVVMLIITGSNESDRTAAANCLPQMSEK